MPSRTRRIIAGTGLAAGLLVGSIAPAAALPGEPEDAHCERIERFEARALDRIERIGDKIERTEAIIDRFEARSEARPERADRWQRRIDRMAAKAERLETRIDKITDRYDAIAEHCGADPLFPTNDENLDGDLTVDETPGNDTAKPDLEEPATT